MLNFASWPKVLTVTGGLAIWVLSGMWIVGTYMLSDVERSVAEFRAEAGERFSAREREDAAVRAELAEATRELRAEVAALRQEIGALGSRVVASNGKVGDRVDVLRKELAAAIEKQGDRINTTIGRLDRDADALVEEVALFNQESFKRRSKSEAALGTPRMVPDATP